MRVAFNSTRLADDGIMISQTLGLNIWCCPASCPETRDTAQTVQLQARVPSLRDRACKSLPNIFIDSFRLAVFLARMQDLGQVFLLWDEANNITKGGSNGFTRGR